MKSFRTQYGEIVDCIDVYKQLAFDHSVLKNQKFQVNIRSVDEYLLSIFHGPLLISSVDTKEIQVISQGSLNMKSTIVNGILTVSCFAISEFERNEQLIGLLHPSTDHKAAPIF